MDILDNHSGMIQVDTNCIGCGLPLVVKNPKRGKNCIACHNKKQKEYMRSFPTADRLLWSARSRAKKKGIEFSLTREDIEVPEFCPVLGIELRQARRVQDDQMPTLDRFDNSKGYVPGNVRVISWRANKLKSNATADELRNVVAYMDGY